MNIMAELLSLRQWLVENEMDSLDTVLVLFVVAFILLSKSPLAVCALSLSYLIGNKHGKKETFYTGQQQGYKEGIKDGMKQARKLADAATMQVAPVLAAAVFSTGLLVGFKIAKAIYQT
jgi:hypothetical protein